MAQATDIAGNRGPIGPPWPSGSSPSPATTSASGPPSSPSSSRPPRPISSGASGPSRPTPPPAATSRPVRLQRRRQGRRGRLPLQLRRVLRAALERRDRSTSSSAPAGPRCRSPATTTPPGPSPTGPTTPNTAVWAIALPQARRRGRPVRRSPAIDIPVPAAYDGNGVTEIAVFRPESTVGDRRATRSPSWPAARHRQPTTGSASPTRRSPRSASSTRPATSPPRPTTTGSAATSSPSTGRHRPVLHPERAQPSTTRPPGPSGRSRSNLPGGPRVGDVPVSVGLRGHRQGQPGGLPPLELDVLSTNPTPDRGPEVHPVRPGRGESSPRRARCSTGSRPSPGYFATTGGISQARSSLRGRPPTPPPGGAVHTLSIASASTSSTVVVPAVPSLVAVASPMVLSTTVAAGGLRGPGLRGPTSRRPRARRIRSWSGPWLPGRSSRSSPPRRSRPRRPRPIRQGRQGQEAGQGPDRRSQAASGRIRPPGQGGEGRDHPGQEPSGRRPRHGQGRKARKGPPEVDERSPRGRRDEPGLAAFGRGRPRRPEGPPSGGRGLFAFVHDPGPLKSGTA